jgi:hypothetical protein
MIGAEVGFDHFAMFLGNMAFAMRSCPAVQENPLVARIEGVLIGYWSMLPAVARECFTVVMLQDGLSGV